MTEKKSSKKGTKKDENKKKQKEKKNSLGQRGTEIISKEELNDKGGICGDTTFYLAMFLIFFFDGAVIYHHSKKLIDLAQFIHKQKVLYTHKNGGYKLMEFSSIHAELGAIKKSVEKQYEREKMEKKEMAKKLKSKY